MKYSFLNRVHLTTHLAFYVGIFVVFLTTGVWSGRLIGSSGSFFSPPPLLRESAITDQMPTTVPATDQRNLLVIGVDNLQAAKPELESAWLVMYFPGKPDFTLLPIYPSPEGRGVRGSVDLLASFSLDPAGHPNLAFLNQLADWIWWNNYLVIDQNGIIALIDMLGGISLNDRNLDGAQVMARMPSSDEDSNAAYSSQVSLLAGICDQTKIQPSKKAIVSTLQTIETNLSTDLDLIDFLDTWLNPTKKSLAVRCEFPLRTTSIP